MLKSIFPTDIHGRSLWEIWNCRREAILCNLGVIILTSPSKLCCLSYILWFYLYRRISDGMDNGSSSLYLFIYLFYLYVFLMSLTRIYVPPKKRKKKKGQTHRQETDTYITVRFKHVRGSWNPAEFHKQCRGKKDTKEWHTLLHGITIDLFLTGRETRSDQVQKQVAVWFRYLNILGPKPIIELHSNFVFAISSSTEKIKSSMWTWNICFAVFCTQGQRLQRASVEPLVMEKRMGLCFLVGGGGAHSVGVPFSH